MVIFIAFRLIGGVALLFGVLQQSFDYVTVGLLKPARGEKNGGSRLTWEQVREIRRLYGEKKTYTQLMAMFNMSRPQIYNIVRHKQWKE